MLKNSPTFNGLLLVFLLFIAAVAKSGELENSQLFTAIRNENLADINAAIKAGADINAPNVFGFTPLSFSSNPEILKNLVKSGARVNFVMKSGDTALISAASFGSEHSVAALIELGENINAIDKIGRTPIMRACDSAKFDSVIFLAEHGADLNVSMSDGNTALMMCVVSSAIILKNIRDKEGNLQKNPLYEEKMNKGLSAIQALVKNGAKVDTHRKNLIDGTQTITPLGVAIKLNKEEIVAYLLEHGALEK